MYGSERLFESFGAKLRPSLNSIEIILKIILVYVKF